ncbi:hypothetical protein L6164_031123 [Bauhinia variegata]|uniref:Uncharacterized protein n=1 Tax=Bauhinia variegata TaxID=167791 RepID=A0ACB9LEG4_BAUVA|nr:hypothetical protein L6164_031123 [Bauhinia variegata]
MPIFNACQTMMKWFSAMIEAALMPQEIVSCWVSAGIHNALVGVIMKSVDRILFAAFACFLALGGFVMGTIIGGIKGQTSEAGFLDGAGKGAVTGAIAALELLDFEDGSEPLSKVALLGSLLNGKVLMQWVCPAVAHTYQWHIGTPETIYREVSDIYDISGVPGLSQNIIQTLGVHHFDSSQMFKLYNDSCCPICFQDFEDGEMLRTLPKCGHFFHLGCIDKWLIQQGSCPMCRTCVHDHIHDCC